MSFLSGKKWRFPGPDLSVTITLLLNQDDSTDLQKDFCALKEWSDYWLLKLNINKCNVGLLSMSYSNTIIKYKYSASVDNMIFDLERYNKVIDLGVIVDSKLPFSDHITEKVNKAYSILGIIKRNFQHVDKVAFLWETSITDTLVGHRDGNAASCEAVDFSMPGGQLPNAAC